MAEESDAQKGREAPEIWEVSVAGTSTALYSLRISKSEPFWPDPPASASGPYHSLEWSKHYTAMLT